MTDLLRDLHACVSSLIAEVSLLDPGWAPAFLPELPEAPVFAAQLSPTPDYTSEFPVESDDAEDIEGPCGCEQSERLEACIRDLEAECARWRTFGEEQSLAKSMAVEQARALGDRVRELEADKLDLEEKLGSSRDHRDALEQENHRIVFKFESEARALREKIERAIELFEGAKPVEGLRCLRG